MASVVVAGGTGFLGREITGALLDAGHAVTVLSRTDSAGRIDARATWVAGDVTDRSTLPSALAGAGAVVDAVQFPNSPIENPKKGYTFERVDLGGTKHLVDAAGMAGVAHFIGLSGAGAAEQARYHWLRFKWEEEQFIQESGVPFTIFRPSWVFGPGDVALNRFLGFAKILPFVPVVGNGAKIKINPLYVKDLAAHVTAAIDRGAVGRIFGIGGPQVLSMNQIIQAALQASGRRRFLLRQPKPLMKGVAGIAQFLPGRPLTPDAIDFITMSGIVDTTDLRRTFGLRLTPLEEGLADYLGK